MMDPETDDFRARLEVIAAIAALMLVGFAIGAWFGFAWR